MYRERERERVRDIHTYEVVSECVSDLFPAVDSVVDGILLFLKPSVKQIMTPLLYNS